MTLRLSALCWSCALLLGFLGCKQPEGQGADHSAASQPTAAATPQPPAAPALPLPAAGPQPAAAAPDAPEARAQLRVGPDEPEVQLDAERFPGSAFFVRQILSELAVARMHALKPVGSTSTVFRANLDAPFRAAFKAATRQRPRGPTAEVAAYRLARLLGLSNVPPAVLRRVPKLTLQRELEARSAPAWPQISERLLTDAKGEVEGAAIYWIDGLRDLPMSERAERDALLRALQQESPLHDDKPPLRTQLSSLIVFDWLIGNTDRWSGANVKGDAAGQLLYMRDHDFGFGRLGAEQEQKLFALVQQTERFSHSLIARIRGLTRARFERELAQDPNFPRTPARIDEQAMTGVFTRRDKLLAHIDSLIERYGSSSVLSL